MRYFVAAEKKTEIFQLLLLLAATAGGEFFFVCVNAWCFVSSARLHNLEKQKAMAHCLTKPFGFGFFAHSSSFGSYCRFFLLHPKKSRFALCVYVSMYSIAIVFVFHLHFLQILLLSAAVAIIDAIYFFFIFFQTYITLFHVDSISFLNGKYFHRLAQVNEQKKCKRAYSTGWNEEINI